MTENTSPGGSRADAEFNTGTNGHRSRADDLLAAMPADFGKATARRRRADSSDDGKADRSPYPDWPANYVARAKAQEASEKRLKRWASRRYDLRILDGRSEPWARALAADIARRNAGRDPVKDMPEVMFSGDKAVNAGATDAALTALPSLTPDEIAALRIEAAAALEATRMQVRQLGRRIAAEHDAAVPAPDPVTLDALLDEPDEGATYRVGGLWPTAGRVLLAAPFKSGKSTMVGNLIRTLVDGGRFLDRFEVLPVGKVVLIDTELDRRTLRRWLRAQRIRNVAAVTVVPLRGAVSSFDITNPAVRTEWVQRIAVADVVVLDCLRPVLDALGLSEDKDAGKVLVAFDALLAEAGADEGMVVTHMGHQNERARGDSRLLDWPDALWKIVRGGDDDSDDEGRRPRYFSAMGRDVTLAEGELTYDDHTRHLAYAGGSRKESAARAAVPELLALVRAEPGTLSKNAAEQRLKDDHGIPQRMARDAIAWAIKDRQIETVAGPHNSKLLKPFEGPVEVSIDPVTDGDTGSGTAVPSDGDQG